MSEIVHTAIVTSVSKDAITASFERSEACGKCALKDACGQAKEQHEISVAIDDGTKYVVGQKVEVVISGAQAFYAAFWGYILPLVIVLATMMVTYVLTADETLCAVLSLSSLVVYYPTMLGLRKYFNKSFQIKIR